MRIMKPIEIFRVGPHAPEIGAHHLGRIASSYSAIKHEAPLTIGHPADNGPAYGWVDDVFVKGDSLYATLKQIDDELLDAFEKGHYKKISASFYKPDAPTNPTPGQYSLRHVGFLGAMPPAVKGLSPAQFNDKPDDYLTYNFDEQPEGDSNMNNDDNTKFMGQFLGSLFGALGLGSKASAQSVDNADTPKPAAVTPQPTDDFAEREAKLTAREKAIKEAEAKAAQTESENYAEQLIKDGKLLPAHKAAVISILEGINSKDTVSFDDKGSTITQSKRDAVKALLDSLPKQVDFGEATPPGGNDATPKRTNYRAPDGFEVDQSQLAVHQAALNFQEKNGGKDQCDYVAAVQAVSNL